MYSIVNNINMGNQPAKFSPKDVEAKSVIKFLNDRRSITSSISTETSVFTLEKRWQIELLQTLAELSKHKKWQDLSRDLGDIVKTLDKNMFAKAISTFDKISGIQINQFEFVKVSKTQNPEDLGVSKYVTIRGSNLQEFEDSENSPTKILQKKSLQTIRKQVGYVIRRELNQKYHPVRELKQSFMMMFQMKFRSMMDEKPFKQLSQKQKIYELMFEDIDFFCELVVKGCVIYKPWVMKQTGIKELKYLKFAKKMVVQSLFSTHSIHEKIFPFMLQLNREYIESICKKLPQNPKIQNFHVSPQLQIQGHYVESMMLFSEIDSFTSPRKTLQQLNKIKYHVCTDIENYHQLFETGQTYQIDGDNLLGIICFMLCKLKMKLLPIYSQLQLLFVAYGDNLASVFQSASYMVSTITAAFDYLDGPHFQIQ